MAQRRVFNERKFELGTNSIKFCAIISDSALARGAITAMGWLAGGGAKMKSWPLKEVGAAMAWLRQCGCPVDEKEMQATLDELLRTLKEVL